MRKGGRTLGVSRGGSGSGGGGGGGGSTEGGEDRDTKGFDVQPFHRLYFSARFYPFAARALARSFARSLACSPAIPRITPLYTSDPPARAKSSHRLMPDNSRCRVRSREYFLGFSISRPTPLSDRSFRESLNRTSRWIASESKLLLA